MKRDLTPAPRIALVSSSLLAHGIGVADLRAFYLDDLADLRVSPFVRAELELLRRELPRRTAREPASMRMS